MDMPDFFDLDLVSESQETEDGEGDDDAGDISPGSELFRKRPSQSGRIVALAFTVPDSISTRDQKGLTLTWSREAIAAFASIRKAARATDDDLKSFPFAYLRGALEVCLGSVLRLERDVGLGGYALERSARGNADTAQPFAYLENATLHEIDASLRAVLNDWFINNLFPKYADPGKVDERCRASVIQLLEEGRLVTVNPFSSRAMPWTWNPKTGTTNESDESYRALADLAAKTLAGKELFQGLGPMHRLVSSSGRMNAVELITAPVAVAKLGRMSLVVRLRVETVPTLHQPLLVLDVSKRRWLDRIKGDTFDSAHIGGTVFSQQHKDRAFSFYVARRRRLEGGGWGLDNTFDAIRRALALPLTAHDAEGIIRGDADTTTSKALLVYRPGVSGDRHGIQAGVPDLDKFEAFSAATGALGELGLQPFTSLTRVKVKHGKMHEDGARMAEASTVLSAMLETANSDKKAAVSFAADYLRNLSDSQLDSVLRTQIGVGIHQIAKSSKVLLRELDGSGTAADKEAKALATLDRLIRANRAALRRMYGDDLPRLVLFHEDGSMAQVGLRILRAAVQLLWGDFEIVEARVPKGTHGPRSELDPVPANGKSPTATERSARRVEAWKGVTEPIRKSGRRHLCLVMASLFYRSTEGATRRDDPVNKPSTRKALATAGCSVQFLLPPEVSLKGEVNVAEFLMRVQAAMKDLVSAHWGRIDTVASAVTELFPDPATQPREVIGITIVRKQAGRANRSIEASFLPVAIRLDVSTGRCSLRYAYESAKFYKTSPWEPLPEALSRIAGMPPVKLSEDRQERNNRFMRFVQEIIGQSVEKGCQPVVLIDSSNAVRLWPWLADVRMDAGSIDIGEREFMHEEWAGARIVRLRQDLTPSLIEDKRVELTASSESDSRPCKELSTDVSLSAPTSPGQGLFRLGGRPQSGCVAYISIGRKLLHQQKRGVSCFRSVTLPRNVKRNDRPLKNSAGRALFQLGNHDVYFGQWPSPNPLEIVVTLRQRDDDPDRLAELVERLRYGFGHYREWTSLPAPLFFERVVREYITQFDITSDDEAVDGVAD